MAGCRLVFSGSLPVLLEASSRETGWLAGNAGGERALRRQAAAPACPAASRNMSRVAAAGRLLARSRSSCRARRSRDAAGRSRRRRGPSVGLDDGERRRDGDRRIERVAALGQHVEPGLRGERMRARDGGFARRAFRARGREWRGSKR